MNLRPRTAELEWADWAELIRYYYAYITLIDRQIGRLLDYLEKTDLRENTMIVFTADHGETLGSHGGLSNKGWTHFEEIQRIPMIIAPPQDYLSQSPDAVRVRPELVSLVDLCPTLLDYTGRSGRTPPRITAALSGRYCKQDRRKNGRTRSSSSSSPSLERPPLSIRSVRDPGSTAGTRADAMNYTISTTIRTK